MGTIYRNFLSGAISDNPLSSGATTINSAGFANLPTIASPDTMWITLDPVAAYGAPEVVQVTAHTASATSITVLRAQQGSSARSHPQTTSWANPVTQVDLESGNPVGTIRSTLKTTADPGWVLFNQTIVNCVTLYPALWAVLPAGMKSGSDAVLPSMDRVTLMGAGTTTIGAIGGGNSKTLITNNLPAHNHGVSDAGHNHTQNAHAHGVTDPSHNHTQASHNHGVNDPSHSHSDAGHFHWADNGDGGVNFARYKVGGASGGFQLIGSGFTHSTSNTTGSSSASIQASYTGISTAGATATNNANYTGISINNATATNNSATTGITTTNTGTGTSFDVTNAHLGVTFQLRAV